MTAPALSSPCCTLLADGSALFAYEDASAESVMLAGDFSGWGAEPIPLQKRDGSSLWTVQTRPLPAGVRQYKYIVDGRWVNDPANPLVLDDGRGNRNSALVVGMRSLGDPRAIRVLSLNLHTYQEKNERRENDSLAKLERIAFGVAAAGVSVLLLQEVGEHVSSPAFPNAGGVVQKHLERLTRKTWFHAWREAHIGFDVFREGLSILSESPLEDVVAFPLSEGPFARIALFANVCFSGTSLRVGTTHVGWGDAGASEVKRLVAALRDKRAGDCVATLVAGDFNASANEPQVGELVQNGYVDVGAMRKATFPTFGEGDGDKPRGLDRRIDYHFIRATAGRGAPRVDAFQRVFDGAGPEDGLHPRVSDHAGIFAAYSWDPR